MPLRSSRLVQALGGTGGRGGPIQESIAYPPGVFSDNHRPTPRLTRRHFLALERIYEPGVKRSLNPKSPSRQTP